MNSAASGSVEQTRRAHHLKWRRPQSSS